MATTLVSRKGNRADTATTLDPGLRRDDERRSWLQIPRLLTLFVALCSLPALVSCGFQLRGAANYPFTTIFVNTTGSPTLGVDLRRILASSSTARVVDSAKDAQVVLDIPLVVDDKEVLSLSTAGGVREYELTKRISFRLHDADGNDWLPPGQFSVRRAYTFNETEVLARDAEEQRLLKEMQTDAVYQLIRRLQAARKPA